MTGSRTRKNIASVVELAMLALSLLLLVPTPSSEGPGFIGPRVVSAVVSTLCFSAREVILVVFGRSRVWQSTLATLIFGAFTLTLQQVFGPSGTCEPGM